MRYEPFDILESLKRIPPNHIYDIAPKNFILRGYDYYLSERLETYKWNVDRTQLTAYVRGTKTYKILFSLREHELTYSCTCQAWSPNTQCKHVICALLTTMNILVPDAFSHPGQPSPHRKTLIPKLFVNRPTSSPHTQFVRPTTKLEVVLTDREGLPEISIKKDGKPTQSFYGIPTELALLMRGAQDPAWVHHENLLNYLNQYDNTHQLIFETAQHQTPLKWRPSQQYHSATELNVHNGQVEVQARCLLNGIPQNQARPFQKLVANLETQTLSPLQDSSGWNLFKTLQESLQAQEWRKYAENPQSLLSPQLVQYGLKPQISHTSLGNYAPNYTEPFLIPIETFHRLQVHSSKTDVSLGYLTLKINGHDAPLHELDQTMNEPSCAYRLNIFSHIGKKAKASVRDLSYILRAECGFGTSIGSTHEPTFRYFSDIEKARELPPAFKSQKRKAILRETFIRLLAAQSQAEATRIIQESVTSSEFKMYLVKSEAKQLLSRFYAAYQEENFRLAYNNDRWFLLPHDKTQQALLYAIPHEVFGHQIFRDMDQHDEMSIPSPILHANLSELHARLEAAGIELYYHHKPILTSFWEFSFDAQRPPDIDWFEIRPEIKCNGIVINDETWRSTLQESQIIETDEGIRILDINALEVLRSLSAMYPAEQSGRLKDTVVRIPTLQILDWVALRKRGVTVHLSKEDEDLFQQLLNFEKIPTLELPSQLNAKLRSYQKGGYQWLSFLYQHRFGACLADDMGLGKTIQAICLLAGIHEGIVTPSKAVTGPHLVVLPPSLLFNWEHEITRFYPTLKIQWYNSKDRSTKFTDCDVVLTTYGVVRRDIETLEKIPFNVIIFDEAQAVKNIKAHSTGAARRLKGYFKLVMTGTPLENHLGEYFSLIDLCLPGLLGDYDAFKSQMKSHKPPMLEKLLHRTKPFVLRRTKSQILKELPPKIETDVYLDLTDRQKALYQQTIASIRPTIEDAYRTKTAAQARVIALTAILKLRQVCLSPRLLNPTSTEPSPKITCLLDRLAELLEEGHSTLVFSQFTSFLDIVEQEFRSHSIPYARLDGSTPTKKRKHLVEEFQNNTNPSVFLLSLKAGGQGLNLTKASYVFHLDPWWNPAVENQASDRAHRIGQRQTVSIMRLLMHHTIEEKMMDLKQHKLALYEAVMEGSTQRGAGAGISKADFDFLLG